MFDFYLVFLEQVKTMDVLGRCLVTIGIVSLIHCGYSAIQYRTYLKLTEEEFASVPIDVSNYFSVSFFCFLVIS